MRRLAFGLHLDRDERAVVEPRAPDVTRPAVQRRPGADVRRERPHAPPRVARVVRGRARGRPARSSRRRSRPPPAAAGTAASGSTSSSSRAATSAERAKIAPASSSAAIGNVSCAAIGPASSASTVSWIVTPVSRVARQDRALDGRRAAPARQQRRMDVQPERPVEQRRAGSAARTRRRRSRRPARRAAPAVPAGGRGCRAARRPPSPAAARACGRGRAGRRGGSAGRRSRGAPQGARGRRRRTEPSRRRRARITARTGCGRSDAERLLAVLVVGAVDDQHAVEVVELVLHDARGQPFELVAHVLAARILALDRDARRSARPGRGRPGATGSPPRRSPSRPTRSMSRGLTTARGPSSSGSNTKKPRSMPSCVAASPTPCASCISSCMRSTSATSSSSNSVTSFAFIRSATSGYCLIWASARRRIASTCAPRTRDGFVPVVVRRARDRGDRGRDRRDRGRVRDRARHFVHHLRKSTRGTAPESTPRRAARADRGVRRS